MLVRGRGRQKEEEVAASFCYRVCEASEGEAFARGELRCKSTTNHGQAVRFCDGADAVTGLLVPGASGTERGTAGHHPDR